MQQAADIFMNWVDSLLESYDDFDYMDYMPEYDEVMMKFENADLYLS